MQKKRSIDENFIVRFFFVHCFVHVYRVLTFSDSTSVFTPPRFPLFSQIKNRWENIHHALLRNILWTFKEKILLGVLLTIIFSCFNLVVPELIKMFMHFMHEHHQESVTVSTASNFVKTLVAVQILRLVFGEHSKRLFHELAVQIESSLARRLVDKSLKLTQATKKDIPVSEIIQLENVDLKLVFTMFSNMYLLFQTPFTILVAVIMLFYESKVYGFIGIYWFLVVFLVHRQLDEKMTHCNKTKLELIKKRSKINYEILDCIKEAKVIGWENLIIEKNNDLFEVENHDHYLFYFYNSLYDILLLLLPVLVVVTICIFDVGRPNPVTVEQVYSMLSLLGICYEPMKSFRTISISFHDGLISLSKIQCYFNFPQFEKPSLDSDKVDKGQIVIAENTSAHYPGIYFDFLLQIKLHIEINPGEKLAILGRRGQGRTSILKLLNGYMKIIKGEVIIKGSIAYLSKTFFFLKQKVRDNIAFYNEKIQNQKIQMYYEKFGLRHELNGVGGLDASMDDLNMFTKSQLQKIALIRVLCSDADIYLLDCPFHYLNTEFKLILQKQLSLKRKKEGKTVVMILEDLDQMQEDDHVLIIDKGIVEEYGKYKHLVKNQNSKIINFYSNSGDKEEVRSTGRPPSRDESFFEDEDLINQIFGIRMNKKKGSDQISIQRQATDKFIKSVFETTHHAHLMMIEKREKQHKRKNVSILKFIKEFIFSVPLSQTLLILLIIACAELLHVFIHFWMGHLEEDHAKNSYLSFQNMIFIEIILTIGLAVVLYYEGEVSSKIAIIQGNTLYKEALQDLTNKDVRWFKTEYSVKIADSFNHDYEEVFIACHSLLGIYKNMIIFFVTIKFIGSDGFSIFLIFSTVSFLYFSILFFLRQVERKIITHYYDYKYQYVRILEESVKGASHFCIFEKQSAVVKKAQSAYRKLASYKLAERYNSYALSLMCDLMSIILLACAVFYGLQMKIHHSQSNIALIATGIHLLMNGSQVLKNIVKDSVSFQSFFLINLVPFLNLKHEDQRKKRQEEVKRRKIVTNFDIEIQDAIFRQSLDQTILNKLSLRIKEGQKILIYCQNDRFRNMFLFAFTGNYSFLKEDVQEEQCKIQIGGVNLQQIQLRNLHDFIGVIMIKNFYMSGTLRDNIMWNINATDQQADKYVRLLKVNEEIDGYDEKGLDAEIQFQGNKINIQITKRLALIRILLRKCKIVFIKDISSFIGSRSIVQILEYHLPNCTIIKLSNKIESSIDVDRIIEIRNNEVWEDESVEYLQKNGEMGLGLRLKKVNFDGYTFLNKVSKMKRKKY